MGFVGNYAPCGLAPQIDDMRLDDWLSDGRRRIYCGSKEDSVITMPFHSNSFGNEGIRA